LTLVSIELSAFRETEIKNLYPAVIGDKDVVRFQIAVNDSFFMCCCKAFSNLQRIVDRPSLAYWRTTDAVAQRLTFK
jgi:hypothetical protein